MHGWSRNLYVPMDFTKHKKQLFDTLTSKAIIGDIEVVVESTLKEDCLIELLEFLALKNFIVYIQTDVNMLVPFKPFEFNFNTLILCGHLSVLDNIRVRFINPGCWFVAYMSQFNDLYISLPSIFHCLDQINCTRLLIIVDDVVPYELRMFKIVHPGIIIQIVYKEFNYYNDLKQVVYASEI